MESGYFVCCALLYISLHQFIANRRVKNLSSFGNKLLVLLNVIRASGRPCKISAGIKHSRIGGVISVHISFPASLYRFQPQRSSGLLIYKEGGDIDDGLEVSTEGILL